MLCLLENLQWHAFFILIIAKLLLQFFSSLSSSFLLFQFFCSTNSSFDLFFIISISWNSALTLINFKYWTIQLLRLIYFCLLHLFFVKSFLFRRFKERLLSIKISFCKILNHNWISFFLEFAVSNFQKMLLLSCLFNFLLLLINMDKIMKFRYLSL